MPRPRASVVAATSLTAVTAAAVVVALAAPAGAAPARSPLYQASGAGTAVSLVGGAVTSGPTAPSSLKTRSSQQRSDASTAEVDVPNVLHVGTVATVSSTTRNAADTATTVTGQAKTTGIDLLGGVVHADAVTTTSKLVVQARKVVPTATTKFVNLRIAGNPVIRGEVAPNTTIEVPGVARVVLNAAGTVAGTTDGMAVATAMIVTVLDGTLAGSTVAVNATTAQTAVVGAGYAPLAGFALGAQVSVSGDSTASVGPLGVVGMPDVGTGGEDVSNGVASLDLGLLGSAGASVATANGVASNSVSRSTMTSQVTGLSLLGGLVTADTLTSTASVRLRAGSAPTTNASVTFTGLEIAGVPVPLDAAPGLILPLPGLGAVAIRATATTADAAAASALTITLSTAAFGLPAGATIQIGFAYATLTVV